MTPTNKRQVKRSVRAMWSRFPVEQQPRPVILMEPAVRLGSHGFLDGASKLAYHAGALQPAVPLPPGVLERVIAARQEWFIGPVTPLSVLASEHVEEPFNTDRGPQPLPAYRLTISGLADPCVVLDPDLETWWRLDDASELGFDPGPARIEPDGLTLHVWGYGGHTTQFIRAEFSEHNSFVVAHVITTHRQLRPGATVPAKEVYQMTTGRLSSPLADRVLVAESGAPCVVLPVPQR